MKTRLSIPNAHKRRGAVFESIAVRGRSTSSGDRSLSFVGYSREFSNEQFVDFIAAVPGLATTNWFVSVAVCYDYAITEEYYPVVSFSDAPQREVIAFPLEAVSLVYSGMAVGGGAISVAAFPDDTPPPGIHLATFSLRMWPI